ncbi:hypothetical protein Tco_1501639 [Tanacetum coccineum]
MPNVEKNELRLHVFSKSLSRDAERWWNDEIIETTITWSELNDKFFHKYYPLSYTCNSKIPDDLDNRTDYFKFIYWLASKFDNYWAIDKNTKNRLWEFYVNERAKGTIGDLDEYKEPCKRTCSNIFYKPYFDAQEAKDIYEVINREYSPIPILARRDIDNPNELCRTEEFIVVRHSIGNNEEFIAVGPSKTNAVERTPDSMSCIYHELFNKKDRGWEDLAETMIWILPYATVVNLTIHTGTLLNPFQFSLLKRKLTMEEMVNKFIEEGKREHKEMDAFIREFRTTNELLLKERNNSLSELEFEVYELSRAINKA